MDEKNNRDATASPDTHTDEGETPMSKPQWADSLRSLYDSVVDEPIPDSFKDLLAQLDEPKKDKSKDAGSDGGNE